MDLLRSTVIKLENGISDLSRRDGDVVEFDGSARLTNDKFEPQVRRVRRCRKAEGGAVELTHTSLPVITRIVSGYSLVVQHDPYEAKGSRTGTEVRAVGQSIDRADRKPTDVLTQTSHVSVGLRLSTFQELIGGWRVVAKDQGMVSICYVCGNPMVKATALEATILDQVVGRCGRASRGRVGLGGLARTRRAVSCSRGAAAACCTRREPGRCGIDCRSVSCTEGRS